jgi:rod shape-determining protein MreC
VGDLGVSRSQLTDLRLQNETLRARVIELEEAKLENDRLRALTGEAATGNFAGITAAVIGLPTSTYDQIIVLNKGSLAGVVLTQPVITTKGLLGQIIEVGPGYSKVRLLTDQKSGVAALIQRDRQPGVIKGSLDGELHLDFVDMAVEVRPGDTVLTSGLGGIFPKGLVVGEVTEVSDEVNTLYKSIVVHPNYRLSDLEEVMILTDVVPDVDTLPQPDTGTGSEGGQTQ